MKSDEEDRVMVGLLLLLELLLLLGLLLGDRTDTGGEESNPGETN